MKCFCFCPCVSVFLWCKLIAFTRSCYLIIRSSFNRFKWSYLNQFRCVQMLNFQIYSFIIA